MKRQSERKNFHLLYGYLDGRGKKACSMLFSEKSGRSSIEPLKIWQVPTCWGRLAVGKNSYIDDSDYSEPKAMTLINLIVFYGCKRTTAYQHRILHEYLLWLCRRVCVINGTTILSNFTIAESNHNYIDRSLSIFQQQLGSSDLSGQRSTTLMSQELIFPML